MPRHRSPIAQLLESRFFRSGTDKVNPSPPTLLKQETATELLTNEPKLDESSTSEQSEIRKTPEVENQYYDDSALRRVLDLYLPSSAQNLVGIDLAALGKAVLSSKVLGWLTDADRHPPYLRTWDMWGEGKDQLVTSEGWKNIWNMGISECIASPTTKFEGHDRFVQFVKLHLYTASSGGAQFHLSLSDGVAVLLKGHLDGKKIDGTTRRLFQFAHDHLTCCEPLQAWTSGLWMTERGGGSDLTPTETTATYMPLDKGEASLDADGFPLGPWVINGFKWFSTATEGSMAIVLARTTKGLSAFYAPMRCMATDSKTFELNGVRIRRLKSKLGTKSLPTAELEINGMRAYLIGQDGKGIQEVGVVLNVTRIHLAVSGLGGWGRVLGATRAFARIRRVARGTRLSDVPLHMRTLANAHITYRAHMLLGFFVVSLLQSSEDIGKPETHSLIPKALQDVQCLLRLLGSVAKATIAKASVVGAQTAIESLGGLGYLENEETEFNVARLYRDAAVLCVGEGTTDVVATDVIKVFKGKIGSYVLKALGRWVTTSIPQHESMVDEKATLLQQWKDLQTAVSSNSFDHLVLNAREVMDHVCKLVCGILLLADAARDSDFVAAEIAQRWIKPPSGLVSGIGGEQELLMNQRIVFGNTSAWLAG